MEQTTLILLVLTNLLVVILLGVFGFFIYRLLRQQHGQLPPEPKSPETPAAAPGYHPEILQRMQEAKLLRTKRADLFCPNHPDEPGETTCAICDHLYCRSCIRPFKTLHFCKEHLPLIMRNDWEEVLTIKTSTSAPEEGVQLYARKRQLFEQENFPTYVETHYKINVDQDHIETYLVLFAQREQVEEARLKFTDLS